MFINQACFVFFPSGQVSLSFSYLTVFDASQKRNCSVISPGGFCLVPFVLVLFYRVLGFSRECSGTQLSTECATVILLRLKEELQFATLPTELNVSL